MALALQNREHIPATAERLSVDGKPTDWWHVYVPSSKQVAAAIWIRGWESGNAFGRIDMKAALHGHGFEDTARNCGYPELIAPKVDSGI
jgi:hypothetical protein